MKKRKNKNPMAKALRQNALYRPKTIRAKKHTDTPKHRKEVNYD